MIHLPPFSGQVYQLSFIPEKILERASTICTTCIALVRFAGYKIAIEKQIPLLVFGFSPGQATIAASVFKSNSEIIQKMQNMIYRPLFSQLEQIINPYFLNKSHFSNKEQFPYIINPLAFFKYDEAKIINTIETFGWIKPDDTDPNSTNCLLNALANQLHIDKYGYNPYAAEIAELVRTGAMDRREGLKKLSEPFFENQIQMQKKNCEFKYCKTSPYHPQFPTSLFSLKYLPSNLVL